VTVPRIEEYPVTSQPQPVPGEGRTPGPFLRPLRDLAAWALVGAPAVMLFVAIIRLIPAGDGEQFVSRTQDSFYSFVNLPTIFLPLGAVLLALLVQPQHPKAKLITVIAAVEYAVAAFFGVIFGILVGLVRIAGFSVRSAFEELLNRAAWLAVFGLAAFAVYKVWRGLFYVPKPQAQPGMYGSPQYGVPGTYPGQPGYGQPPAGQQPSWNQPAYGQPAYGQPPAWGQPQPGQSQPGQPETGQHTPPPGTYGGFGSQPAATQPMPPSAQPASAPPASAPPVSGAPAGYQPGQPPTYGNPSFGGPSFGAPGGPGGQSGPGGASGPGGPGGPGGPNTPGGPSTSFAEPTQAVPQHQPLPGHEDRTEVVRDERPGFGPADQDPPRH
jgi:hypothetical protein